MSRWRERLRIWWYEVDLVSLIAGGLLVLGLLVLDIWLIGVLYGWWR